MPELPDECIHLVVTSPPYWQLKDYGVVGQIGYDETYVEYLDSLRRVWSESARVLHPGCRMCINVGDQFARAKTYGRYKVIPLHQEIIAQVESLGLDYMGAIIWQKATTTNTTGGASVMGSYPYPRNGMVAFDYEYILLFKKLGKPPVVLREAKEASRLTNEEWGRYFVGHWQIPGERQNSHLAMFPVEIPKRLIHMYSFVGETVLDPFLGSGTTLQAAEELSRMCVGIEIDPECESLIVRRSGANVSITVMNRDNPVSIDGFLRMEQGAEATITDSTTDSKTQGFKPETSRTSCESPGG
jgi:DNA modification methylase